VATSEEREGGGGVEIVQRGKLRAHPGRTAYQNSINPAQRKKGGGGGVCCWGCIVVIRGVGGGGCVGWEVVDELCWRGVGGVVGGGGERGGGRRRIGRGGFCPRRFSATKKEGGVLIAGGRDLGTASSKLLATREKGETRIGKKTLVEKTAGITSVKYRQLG